MIINCKFGQINISLHRNYIDWKFDYIEVCLNKNSATVEYLQT